MSAAAAASQPAGVHQNGIGDFDPDDPECQRQMWRPPDIDQDMKEMDNRRRVDVILNSQVFREELERIIEAQLNDGYLPASLSALQQVTELLLPHSSRNSTTSRLGNAGPPVNDIRGIDGLRYAKGEKLLRCKLASVYRLVEMYGWSMGIYNHITVRVNQDHEHFLLNPFGLQYHEITASALLKVDMQGNVIDPGSTNFTFNKAGFILHSAIHSSRPDIKAIIHLHYPPCVAVSTMKQGLLIASQEAAILGPISYHDYRGLLIDAEERALIARNLGPSNKVLILRNHGVVTCGESLEEAFFLMNNLVMACETQIRMAQVGIENIRLLPEETVEQVRSVVLRDGGSAVQGLSKDGADADKLEQKQKAGAVGKKWKIWDLEFEAQMRMMDNAGFRTGFIYRQPLLRNDTNRARSDVELPPSATSQGNQYDEDKWLSPLRKLVQGRKTQDKMNWVNSPNTYQKVEVLESGTTDPKKITKWVQDGSSPAHSTPIKLEGPNQFVPVNGGDRNEFKRKQKEMKEIRMKNMVSCGPQSHILEGVNWEEARNMSTTQTDGYPSTNSNHVVMVGAASKGIIQRDFQHNATVYKSAYAKNPFDNVTEEELKEYRELIEKKQRGEIDELPDNVKALLLEPISLNQDNSQDIASPTSPTSPLSDEEDSHSGSRVQRSHSARLALQATLTEQDFSEKSQKATEDKIFSRGRFQSERKPKNSKKHPNVNGDDKHGERSKEGSPVKDASSSDKKSKDKSDKKDKKKSGIRTSFFSKKKSKNKEAKAEGAE